MMSAALSRRLGRVVLWEPLVSMDAIEQLELSRLAFLVSDFADLPERYQRLIDEAEANRARWLAEHPVTARERPEGSVA